MKQILPIILCLFISSISLSQTQTKKFEELKYMRDSLDNLYVTTNGEIMITQDKRLEEIIYNYSRAFKNKSQRFWRVQIFFGIGRKGRAEAKKIKSNFENNHPETPVILIFEEPYFKVRAGCFDTRLEAEKLKFQLIEDYDKIFITQDDK